MLCFVALLTGTFIGTYLVLVPGLSLALLISIAIGLGLSGIEGAIFIASASGAGLFTKRLALVMHPNANTGCVASLDPVMTLVAEGLSRDALDIMVATTVQAYKYLGALGLGLAVLMCVGLHPDVFLKAWLNWMIIPVIGVWLVYTCLRSKHWYMTCLLYTSDAADDLLCV